MSTSLEMSGSVVTFSDADVLKTRIRHDKASELSGADQNDFAKFILDELESERRWEPAFGDSQDERERLADEALEEHEAGNSQELGLNRL